ncbi:hypothetical protein [Hanstruepera marina]|uniref:hypothetical protein n=1 Tax=Hanstruepera marina TaxID=2873265 RepID=UPI001CA76E63|nr:hypothetical protein [Hanstruepera marina]
MALQSSFSQINSSKKIVESMKSMYNNKWYSNLTFKQKTSFYQNDTLQREETWYEAMKMPEGLIVKTGSMDSGNGFIFKKDSMMVFTNGDVTRKMKTIHDLLVLGFSVYFETSEETIDKLVASGFDLSYFKDLDKYYVIGNPEKKQAWIEKERLLFYKVEYFDRYNNKMVTEFNKYQRLGQAWIAPEVLFFRNGKLYMKEEYYDIDSPNELPKGLFNTATFKSASW